MDSEIDYRAVLIDLNRRRSELDGAAAVIQQIVQSWQPGVSMPKASHATEIKEPRTKVVNFHGWTVWRAAQQFLKNCGRPQTTRQIMDGLLAGGLKTKAKHFDANLYTLLGNKAHIFKRVNAGLWGLAEWEA